MAPRTAATGANLVLASLLATLSYVPFELVAKLTLIVCLIIFVLDPFPESRLVAVGGVGGVLLLNRARQHFLASSETQESQPHQDNKTKSE
ncbi:hypothetical protein ACHAXT_001506 [Thalassiosira profunda]